MLHIPMSIRRPAAGPESGSTALLPLSEGPCPSCTALIDQLEGAAEHVSQRVNLAVVARVPLPLLLPLAAYSFNRDCLGETADRSQMPIFNVFHHDSNVIYHFWGAGQTGTSS